MKDDIGDGRDFIRHKGHELSHLICLHWLVLLWVERYLREAAQEMDGVLAVCQQGMEASSLNRELVDAVALAS